MAGSRPKVIISAAVSVDGRIATRTGDSRLSSGEDLIRLHRLRSRVDAILVGKNTVLRDDPMLTVRRARGRNPARIVLDPDGTIPSSSRMLRSSGRVRTVIATTQRMSAANRRRLEKFPLEIVTAGKTRIGIALLLRRLHAMGFRSVLVEGGGATNWEFVSRGLFDEMIITVSPRIIGGLDSVPLVGGRGFGRVADSPNLALKSAKRLKNHLVLRFVRI